VVVTFKKVLPVFLIINLFLIEPKFDR